MLLVARGMGREKAGKGLCVHAANGLVCLYWLCPAQRYCWNRSPAADRGYCWSSPLFLRSPWVRLGEEYQHQGQSFFMQDRTDGDHMKELQSAQDPARPYTDEYNKSLCSAYMHKKDCQIMFTLWRGPKTSNQQNLHFRLCFDAENVHPSIWLGTKPFCELHRVKEGKRSTGSIKSKWWEKSSQLRY